MTPYQKIDRIFAFLKTKADISSNFGKEYIWSMYVVKTPELKINRQLYDEIIKKLIEDDFIRENKPEGSQPTYHLTIKGLLFDGYDKTTKDIERLSRQTRFLTRIASIGTGLGGIYVILEILNSLFSIYPTK